MLPLTCQSCGNSFSEFDVDCPTCGADLEPQRSQDCSGPNPDNPNRGPRFHFSEPEAWMSAHQNSLGDADYEVLPKIEKGEWGTLYPLKDRQLHREALLWTLPVSKTYPDTQPGAALNHASGLNHPHVAAIYDMVRFGDRQGVILEGGDLRNLADSLPNEGFPANQASALAGQACSALTALHGAGLFGWDQHLISWCLDAQGLLKLFPHRGKWSQRATSVSANPVSNSDLEREDISALGSLIGQLFCGPPLPVSSTGKKPIPPPQPIAALMKRCRNDPSLTLAQIDEALALPPRKPLRRVDWRWLILLSFAAMGLFFIVQWLGPDGASNATRAKWSLAVLPFQMIGGEPGQGVFCDGLGYGLEQVLEREIQGTDAWVLVREDFQSAVDVGAHQLNRSFGITWVLTGHLRQEGNRWRLTLILLEAASSRQLGQRVLMADQADSQGLFRQMVSACLSLLGWENAVSAKSESLWEKPNNDVNFQSYVRGLGFLTGSQLTHAQAAQRAFEATLERDPDFAPAKLGRTASLLAQLPFTDDRAPLLEILGTSVAEDPEWLPDWQTLWGRMYLELGQWGLAEKNFKEALMSDIDNPNLRRALARAYSHLGQGEKALAQYSRVLNWFPAHTPTLGELATLFSQLERTEEQKASLEKLRQIAPEHRLLGGLPVPKK